jgi:hypothetical protein
LIDTMNTTDISPMLDFSNFFQTRSQANDFSARLETITEQAYHTTFNIEKALMEQFGIAKKDKFLTLLRDNKVGVDQIKPIKDFIKKVQTIIASLPVVPITIAFEPKEQTLQLLSEWFMVNLKKQVLFDITVDRKLIAGAAITFNGKYRDFSIKTKFNETTNRVLTQKAPVNVIAEKTPPMENLHLGR